jgi:hypothetical protein
VLARIVLIECQHKGPMNDTVVPSEDDRQNSEIFVHFNGILHAIFYFANREFDLEVLIARHAQVSPRYNYLQ